MDTKQAIETRRSVKHYDPNYIMTPEEVDELLSLAILSPTAFNIQNWRFVVVTDSELRKQIRKAAWDQAQVTDASLFIVLCADLKAWDKNPERYWTNAPREVQEFVVPAIDSYYRGKDQVQRDEAMRSCGIAAQTFMLAAKAMGYDSCPMDGFDFGKVAEQINLPADHVIAMFIAVGKGVKDAWPRGGRKEEGVMWKSTLEQASWPVTDILKAVIDDACIDVLCLNSCHGKDDPALDDIICDDISFLQKFLQKEN